MLLALCTGYHPFGEFGERVSIETVDNVCHELKLSMIPLRASVIVTVKELVPYNEAFIEQLASDAQHPGTRLDLQNAMVLLRDRLSRRAHKFIAVPVCQQQLVSVRDVISGKLCMHQPLRASFCMQHRQHDVLGTPTWCEECSPQLAGNAVGRFATDAAGTLIISGPMGVARKEKEYLGNAQRNSGTLSRSVGLGLWKPSNKSPQSLTPKHKLQWMAPPCPDLKPWRRRKPPSAYLKEVKQPLQFALLSAYVQWSNAICCH